jgi:eukaryotic-like serine/threonine-protein kinase
MSLEGKQIGRYCVLQLLGSGGMGDVYLAEDARISQQVAVKVIHTVISWHPDEHSARKAVLLFQREAMAIVKLDHPNILPLYDYGEESIENVPTIYLVMPYRPEGSLADWLCRRGRANVLSPLDVASIVRQAADALQHTHNRQVIHQDVKPSNFLIRNRKGTPTRPDLLLTDFGIARLSSVTANMSQSVYNCTYLPS